MWSGVRNVVAIVAVYYLLPLQWEGAEWLLWLRVAGFVVGLVFVVLGVRQAAVRQVIQGGENLPLAGLVELTVGGVVVFALGDYALATGMPGEFIGLETKTDGLYFAVSTLATVGFGDVHAVGQLARGLVLIQMVFNLVVLATAFTLLSRRVVGHVRGRRPSP
ncbi:potassium channel family protein [Nonomuraea longicatena]